MPGIAHAIKDKIAVDLQALVTAGTLGAYIQQDINTNVLDIDFPHYPCAVLGTSRMESDWEYPQANKRTYIFDILVVQLVNNLTDAAQMEDLRDAVALQFDNNVTLSGASELGVSAVFSEIETYASKGQTFVLFNVTIKATTLQSLTYNF